MKRVFFFPTVVFLITLYVLVHQISTPLDLYDLYAQKMQIPLFTGFLTIGGFLLSLKTFILIKLKEGLYDSEGYRKRLAKMRKINPALSLYGPLSRLSSFLVYCVLLALMTSLSQFTFGFVKADIAAAICISMAAATLSLVLLAWWAIRKSLKDWFEILEENEDELKE